MGYNRSKYEKRDKRDKRTDAAKKDGSNNVKPEVQKKSNAFVCFLVDGSSEEKAFSSQFEELFDMVGGDRINVEFRQKSHDKQHEDAYADPKKKNQPNDGGDITAFMTKGVPAVQATPKNIAKLIYEYYFKRQDKASGLGWDDLTTIIHIIDMDGAYVWDDRVHEFTSEEEAFADSLNGNNQNKKRNTLYLEDHIAVRAEEESETDSKNVTASSTGLEKLLKRNAQKRENIDYLLSLNGKLTVHRKTVNYYLYFFSSNLDHFLFDDANLPKKDKSRKADEFRTSNSDADALCKFFDDSCFTASRKLKGSGMDLDWKYKESWDEFRRGDGTASLARWTNVDLLIEKIKNSTLEDWL
ncbi:MAG: hypothetical protein K5897_07210 [Eubacterium sp.]|nr:hypothetical protein [Eubacterium sp.]